MARNSNGADGGEDDNPTLSGCDPEDSDGKAKRVWSLGGHRVCFRGWCQLVRVGPCRVHNCFGGGGRSEDRAKARLAAIRHRL